MAYSFVTYTSAGGQTYNVPFPYLEQAHVKVYINGVATSAFTWSDAATIHLTNAPAVGATVLIKRETPRDGMDKSFSAQPRLKGTDLDEALLQAYYIGLEALDGTQLNWDAIEAKDLALAAQAAAEAAADLAATYTGVAGAGTYMEVLSAPTTDANEVKLYAKDVSGVAELFIRKESNGAEIQVTSGGILKGEIRKNAIINGNFRIWQRGTPISVPTGGGDYVADRWFFQNYGGAAHTISQDTVANGVENENAVKCQVTTADVDIQAGDNSALKYGVEGWDFRRFIGKQAVLSFWVKATKTGTYCISFTNAGSDRSFIAEYTISQSNTWEKKTVPITFNYSGGTWDYTTGLGLRVWFTIACGSTYQTTPGAWQTGNFIATVNQVNGTDSVSNAFCLSMVQLELGSVATPFENIPFQQELSFCQRYYATGVTGLKTYATAGMNFAHYVKYPVTMRATPSVITYSGQVYYNASGVATSTPFSVDGHTIYATATGTGVASFETAYQVLAEI